MPEPRASPPSLLKRMKAWAKQLKREILALYYCMQDPRCPRIAKILPMIALAYALSPIDLIPDFIPILGYLDDVIILPVLLWLALKVMPAEVMADARVRAEHEPIRLHQNWLMACAFFAVWLVLGVVLLHMGLGLLKVTEQLNNALVGTLAVTAVVVFAAFMYREHVKARRSAGPGGQRSEDGRAGAREPLLGPGQAQSTQEPELADHLDP